MSANCNQKTTADTFILHTMEKILNCIKYITGMYAIRVHIKVRVKRMSGLRKCIYVMCLLSCQSELCSCSFTVVTIE